MLRSGILSLVLGVAAAAVGLLPWLVTGGAMPAQELSSATPAAPPFVLLPFSRYAVTSLVALIVTGAAIGGLLARIPRLRRGFVLLGVLAGQAVAVVQSAVAVQVVLQHRLVAFLYLVALVAGCVAAMVLGAVALLLLAARHRAAVVVGAALAAVPVGSWLPVVAGGFDVVRWAPPVLVGAAIGWAGLGRVGRVLAALFGLVVLWVGPALATAAQVVAGSRAELHQASDATGTFGRVLVDALLQPAVVLPDLGVAIAVALVVGVVARLVRRARPSARASRGTPTLAR